MGWVVCSDFVGLGRYRYEVWHTWDGVLGYQGAYISLLGWGGGFDYLGFGDGDWIGDTNGVAGWL